MVWRDELCPGKPRVHVSSVDGAVAQGRRPEKLLFDQFSEDFGHALEHGQPILIPHGARAALPEALQPVVTTRIPLAPFDLDMLREVMARVYRDSDVSGADLRARLSEADVKQVSAEDLTLATRAPALDGALSRLRRTGHFPDDNTPGLSEFPLAPDIRAPIEAMLSDLKDWQAGQIAWDDVSRGILLCGPPGCGKTEIPRLPARESGVAVRASSLSQWQSGGARSSDLLRNMRQFFDAAAEASPCIIFIDELDAVGDRGRPHDHNSSWTDSVVGGLLECLDGFETTPGIVVMGATNHPQKIDAALRRPGRFDRTLTMRQPTPDLLPQAFRWHLGGDLAEADLGALTGIATGMTGAEIAAAVRDARGTARRVRRTLTLDDLSAAISDRRPPLDPGLRWQVAVHECGHAIVAHATGRATVNLLSLTAAGGEASMTARPSGLYLDELEADIAGLLAGRAAERLMLGQPSAGAGGQEDSDLAEATRRAVAIELSLGLGEAGPVWHGPPERGVERLRFDRALQAHVRARLDAAEDQALTVLAENRSVLTSMAEALVRDGALSGEGLPFS
ncbi:AAA family ATPase [Salibaculum halophilum]|uniref:AAA family ATPase n=1 Tax=Salibaculum halophilum TaxID=1914408 RepID=UPI000A106282|nr:AAA family ATPase [Salibaculum halophilum]